MSLGITQCYLPAGLKWLGGVVVSVIKRSQVRLPAGAPLGNDSEQVANTHVPQSPNSTIWYQPKGSDALRPGR